MFKDIVGMFTTDETKSIRKVINLLIDQKKTVILTLSSKGGVGKTSISWGLSKEFDIPYITNDYGSLLGKKQKKFYEGSYLIHYFKEDVYFNNTQCVIIDFKGEDVNNLSKEELFLIKLASAIIIPTGADDTLEHSGALQTALDVAKINKKIMFIASDIPKKEIKENMELFKNHVSEVSPIKRDSVLLFPLSDGGKVIRRALRKNINYASATDTTNEEQTLLHKEFMEDWNRIIAFFSKKFFQKKAA